MSQNPLQARNHISPLFSLHRFHVGKPYSVVLTTLPSLAQILQFATRGFNMADAPHQTPPDSDHEQKKLSLQQKLNTLALLITVVLAILNEQQVSVPDYIWEKRHTAIDAFHPRSGLQPGNIAQGINALAILLAKSNVSVSLYTGISSASTPPSDTVLLAATDICLPKSSPAFLGKQYIKISRSYGAEAIGGVQVVGQTFSSLLDDMDNLSNYIDRVR